MEEPSVHRDRLSGLPLSLIHHILSFLPMRDVVSTTLLSKRWVDLWTTVPCLNFCERMHNFCERMQRDADENEDDGTDDEDNWTRTETSRIQNFVNRALILWKGVTILKFKIDIKSSYDSSLVSVSDVTAWTCFAVRNKVEELEIITTRQCWAPQCLKSCSSLRKLSLVGCNLQFHGTPSWNRLKSLTIRGPFGSRISGDMINRILLGSPELEEFEVKLCDSNENLSIRSRSLKKLKMGNLLRSNDKGSPLRICCPNLETLKIAGMICECLFSDVSSLIVASFNIYLNQFALENVDELLGETLKQVFSTIQHVEKVSLSDVCVQVLVATHKKYLHSALPSVKFLKLNLGHEFGDVIDLLGIFPNLKVLLIKHQDYTRMPPDFNAVNYMEVESNLFLLELKTVEISSNFYDFSIFGFIEFLLKHAVK